MKRLLLAGLLGLALILPACGQPPAAIQSIAPKPNVTGIQLQRTATAGPAGPAPARLDTPTPDPTRVVDDAGTELYIVQDGDTFSGVASEFGKEEEFLKEPNVQEFIQKPINPSALTALLHKTLNTKPA